MDTETAKKIIESLRDSSKQSESKEEKKSVNEDKDFARVYKELLVLRRKVKILEVDYANFELCIEENEQLKKQLGQGNRQIISNLNPKLLPAVQDGEDEYQSWISSYIYFDEGTSPATPCCDLCLVPQSKLGDFEKHLFQVHNVQSRLFVLESDIPVQHVKDEEEGSVDPADHGGMKFH